MAPRYPPPLVTGVSPKEGPPGTRITIRGENFGNDPRDLIGLKICGMDCHLSAEWKSSSKIIARTGPGKGMGDIIPITRYGGKGSCTVGFRGYFLQIGPLQESAVWIDESQTVQSNLDRGRPATAMAAKEEEDPLGILDEGDKPKLGEDELLEMFPEASGNMSLENFSPGWYLLEHHRNASFSDLKAGLSYMKRKASTRSEGPITFVRSNLTTILDCLDSLTEMYKKYNEEDIRRGCMDSYGVLLMQAKSCADGLFQEVLGRKDKADSTRNALSVIQKFRFLFHLPLNIQRNIQKGDYNMVINDYEKAKSLFAETEIKIFRKVYLEVERRIAGFRNMLHKRLKDTHNTLDEQKKLIRYLVNLEYKGDPAWECLDNQQNWLVELLDDCKDDHIEEEKNGMQTEHQASTQGGSQWKPVNRANKSPIKSGIKRESSFSSLSSSDQQAAWRFRTPQKVLFIEDITDVMLQHFPDFWRLGQSYFTREKSEKGVKIDTSKHSKMKQMMTEVVSLFSNYVRAAFLPESLEGMSEAEREKFGIWPKSSKQEHISGNWLPICVRNIRNCANFLSGLDGHGDSMIVLKDLAFDMRTNCMFTLLKQAISDVKCLHTKETWVVETDDQSGGTTQLPALFENIVNEAIQHLHEVVVMNKPSEPEIFSQRPIQKEATVLCSQLLQAFSICMEQLAFSPPLQKKETKQVKVVIGQEIELEQHGDPIPSLDKRLIVMLSNCRHTLEVVVPRIIENLTKHGYVEMEKALKAAQDTYGFLDQRLFSSYIQQKSDPILAAMEANLYRGGFSWHTWQGQNQGVRNYLKEIIMSLIEVHSEVFSISPKFVMRVMQKITEAVCEELCRLVQCVTEFNAGGAIQAQLELEALHSTVQIYSTKHVEACFKEAFDVIPELSEEGKLMVAGLLEQFKARMRIQLWCFQSEDEPVPVKMATNDDSNC
ncbi:hypothetical protein RRG08_044127 [Elysia crispata]|uniref:Exocyst complex component 2 n=1 Tax=Elysia crispata TaxID=231223 RepID=A0AAE0Z7Q6_9GAST|nr:hypothetical protein RRG08_044127 [Elysia crispata]